MAASDAVADAADIEPGAQPLDLRIGRRGVEQRGTGQGQGDFDPQRAHAVRRCRKQLDRHCKVPPTVTITPMEPAGHQDGTRVPAHVDLRLQSVLDLPNYLGRL